MARLYALGRLWIGLLVVAAAAATIAANLALLNVADDEIDGDGAVCFGLFTSVSGISC